MPYFAIRHKPSAALFPCPSGGRRGSTYIELPFKGPPRVFATRSAASNCLRWWLAGKPVAEYDFDEFGQSTYPVGASPGPGDENRKADEMEVIEIELRQVGQLELPE